MSTITKHTFFKNVRKVTFLLSSAASSFFWISSRDRSFFLGEAKVRGASEMGDGGFKISSKAWPEARLLICFTSMSEEGMCADGEHRAGSWALFNHPGPGD